MAGPNVCYLCKKSFLANGSMRRHYRLKHPDLELPPTKKAGRPSKKPVIVKNFHCSKCLKSFVNDKAVKVHETVVHRSRSEYVRTVLIRFLDVDGFMTWKREEEDRTMCRFTKIRATATDRDSERRYYACHRSGYFSSSSKNFRRLKMKGSCKMGQKCTAFINLKISASGSVTAKYCPVHTGHGTETTHLTLRDEDRRELAKCIAEGISFDDILDNIHRNSSNPASCLSGVTRKDLHNIAKKYHLQKNFTENDPVRKRKKVLLSSPLESSGAASEMSLSHLGNSVLLHGELVGSEVNVITGIQPSYKQNEIWMNPVSLFTSCQSNYSVGYSVFPFGELLGSEVNVTPDDQPSHLHVLAIRNPQE